MSSWVTLAGRLPERVRANEGERERESTATSFSFCVFFLVVHLQNQLIYSNKNIYSVRDVIPMFCYESEQYVEDN